MNIAHIDIDPTQVHHKALATTIATFVAAILSRYGGVNEMIQDIAGIVAICSGCMATCYYYVAFLEKYRNRRK